MNITFGWTTNLKCQSTLINDGQAKVFRYLKSQLTLDVLWC
uniref:Uncharacterized protein n=1 Tax=Arundo donax TaxID=35708 RepID=A0A0A9A1Q5_ARUDO